MGKRWRRANNQVSYI